MDNLTNTHAEDYRPRDLSNLRNRPFLVVTTVTKPAKGARTNKKNWWQEPGAIEIFERPYVVDRVSKRDFSEATIIVDLLSGDCVKNRFEGISDMVAAAYYIDKYKDHAARAMSIWRAKMMDRIENDPTLNPSPEIAALRANSAKDAS